MNNIDTSLLVLRAILLALLMIRLHQVEVFSPQSVLYLSMTIGAGFALLSEIDRALVNVDFMGPLSGADTRALMANGALTFGVGWMIWRGESRKKVRREKAAKIDGVVTQNGGQANPNA
jgi:hypothetical protein